MITFSYIMNIPHFSVAPKVYTYSPAEEEPRTIIDFVTERFGEGDLQAYLKPLVSTLFSFPEFAEKTCKEEAYLQANSYSQKVSKERKR